MHNELTLDNYQSAARWTAIYRDRIAGQNDRVFYTIMGLAGEAGEVSNKAKRILSKDARVITKERNDELVDELGDVLWYVAMAAYELGFSLDVVAKRNIAKLADRHSREKESDG